MSSEETLYSGNTKVLVAQDEPATKKQRLLTAAVDDQGSNPSLTASEALSVGLDNVYDTAGEGTSPESRAEHRHKIRLFMIVYLTDEAHRPNIYVSKDGETLAERGRKTNQVCILPHDCTVELLFKKYCEIYPPRTKPIVLFDFVSVVRTLFLGVAFNTNGNN